MDKTVIFGGTKPGVAGSRRYTCSLCPNYVYLSKSSQEMLEKNPATQVACIDCYLTNPKVEEREVIPVSEEEIVKFCGSPEEARRQIERATKLLKEERNKNLSRRRKNN